MAFERAGLLSEIEDRRGRCVRIGDVAVGIFRVGEEAFAIENACPHAGYPLSEGGVEGYAVVCPAHGFDYDLRTGFPPGDDDGFPIPRFALELRGDEIWVDLEQPLNVRRRRS